MTPEKKDELLTSAICDIALALYQVTIDEDKCEVQENLVSALTSAIKVFREAD